MQRQIISGNLVDVYNETIFPAEVHIENGRIVHIGRTDKREPFFIIPGFIDAHIHIESSLLPPSEFARLAALHGTIGCVSDPHEIANVLGIAGVEYMMNNAKLTPLKFYFGAPSCVPATPFETSGAKLGIEESECLFQKKEIKFLSEVMDFPGVVQGNPEMLEKIASAKKYHKKIDGHAPGLTGPYLKKYVRAGIQTDHEATSFEEGEEKIKLGMKILIREGSAARNFDALCPLIDAYPQDCMLCSDDLLPEDLLKGHINLLAQRAVQRGMDVMNILRCACIHPVSHYGLEVGTLRVGDPADFIQVRDLKTFEVMATCIDGIFVAKENKPLFDRQNTPIVNHFRATPKTPSDFIVKAQSGRLKVIEAIDGQLFTNQLEVSPKVIDGKVEPDLERDILKIAVINRYRDANPAMGFIKNFGIRSGAIASSIAHDSHNLIAIGTNDEDICKALNCLIRHQGGIAVVSDGQEECLPLPIAGLMSDLEGDEVARRLQALNLHVRRLGCKLQAPFMTLSFMALLVIPRLKISDLGLFDVENFSLVDLFCE